MSIHLPTQLRPEIGASAAAAQGVLRGLVVERSPVIGQRVPPGIAFDA